MPYLCVSHRSISSLLLNHTHLCENTLTGLRVGLQGGQCVHIGLGAWHAGIERTTSSLLLQLRCPMNYFVPYQALVAEKGRTPLDCLSSQVLLWNYFLSKILAESFVELSHVSEHVSENETTKCSCTLCLALVVSPLAYLRSHEDSVSDRHFRLAHTLSAAASVGTIAC